ncbi:MAG: protein translocase subunit SecF [Candidatus Aminicenantes bacterium]|nr:MAG: protein translocase subunit SecF [Candidatus Aminicenantes bacterium]RLE01729.1 MAG: protein translocase subunit SecF [Candidatus Aminicenantes bacterium]
MQIFKNPNYDFMKLRFFAFGLSFLVILIGLINMTVGKGLTYGIDFAGGTLIRIIFKEPVSIDKVRSLLNAQDLGKSRIQQVGHTQKEYIIRTMQLTGKDIQDELEAHEIIGNKVIEALQPQQDKENLNRGLLDLNRLSVQEVIDLLPADLENKEEIAQQILNYRKEKGIIQSYEELATNLNLPPEVLKILQEKTFLGNIAILSRETVGPQVGHDLRRKATQATIWALFGMLIYIGLRFKFAYGISAILTLAHDVLVTVGIFSLTNRELNLPVIAAILTIVGYSLNDTIVIFDRIRDNLRLLRKESFLTIINKSINQTLSRTIITSGTTLLTVIALYLFGGEVINDFAFTMMIGVIAGTYSSIYQSCAYLYFWNKIFKPKKGLRK